LPREERAAAKEVAEDNVEGERVREKPKDAVRDGVDLNVVLKSCGVCWGEKAAR
jgi:hypothetical protein